MERHEITERIKVFLESEFPKPGAQLEPSTDLLQEWFVDSLGITETVLFLESSFGIDMSRADINGTNFRNIGTLSEFVSSRLGR